MIPALTTMLWLCLALPAGAAQAEPAPSDCDRSVIPQGSPMRTVLSPNKGPRWTALGIDSGSALCAYGSRFMVFREPLDEFKGAETAGGTLRVFYKTAKGDNIAYHLFPAKLTAGVEPLRGESATRLYAMRAVYADSARVNISRAAVLAGRDFEKNWNYFGKLALKGNWLWESPRVKNRLAKWVDSEVRKKTSTPAGCVPAVEILTGVPRSYLKGYLDEVSPKRKVKVVSAGYKITVARVICAGGEDNPPAVEGREKLQLDTLLDLFK